MNVLALIVLFGSVLQVTPADSVTMPYCYEQATENYPIAENIDLQEKITDLNVQIANTGYYPNIELGGKASYQSEVTDFSLPGGGGPPPISKDQYEASLSITQNIFSGGAVSIQKELEQAKGEQEVYSTEVELHQIRSQVEQVYFGILLSQQQSKVNALLIENLNGQLSSVRSKVENGVLLPSQQHILKAELIEARQDSSTIQSNIKAGYNVLGELIGEELTTEMSLSLPQTQIEYRSLQPHRPEYDLFRSTKSTVDERMKLVKTKKVPRISAFATTAYGRPGLNFLDDDFHGYYMVGLRLSWNIRDFLNAGHEIQALKIQRQKIMQNQKAFTRQLEASIDKLEERIATLQENIERDREIIELRQKVVRESASQLENGAITATEYVTELTQANRARLSLFINRVELAKARIEYATTLGVPVD